MVSSILQENNLDRGHYAEPFVGGGGLALSLLFKGDVGEIHLNDIDPAISAFWKSILNNPEDFIDVMWSTPITIEERKNQLTVYTSEKGNDLKLGFATFFLNRVNRSGIIKTAGVIGGLKQKGDYLMDCRFNRINLTSRIRRIAKYSSRIHYSSLDAIDFLSKIKMPKRSLIFNDPPYFVKGDKLYASSFKPDDHTNLRDCLIQIESPWILTYDNVPEIRKLYENSRQFTFDMNYSCQKKRTEKELLVCSKRLDFVDICNKNWVLPC